MTTKTNHHTPQDTTFASTCPPLRPRLNFRPPRRSNSGDSQYVELTEGDSSSLGPFNSANPTVVLVHGFANSGDDGWPVEAKTGERWGRDLVADWFSM